MSTYVREQLDMFFNKTKAASLMSHDRITQQLQHYEDVTLRLTPTERNNLANYSERHFLSLDMYNRAKAVDEEFAAKYHRVVRICSRTFSGTLRDYQNGQLSQAAYCRDRTYCETCRRQFARIRRKEYQDQLRVFMDQDLPRTQKLKVFLAIIQFISPEPFPGEDADAALGELMTKFDEKLNRAIADRRKVARLQARRKRYFDVIGPVLSVPHVRGPRRPTERLRAHLHLLIPVHIEHAQERVQTLLRSAYQSAYNGRSIEFRNNYVVPQLKNVVHVEKTIVLDRHKTHEKRWALDDYVVYMQMQGVKEQQRKQTKFEDLYATWKLKLSRPHGKILQRFKDTENYELPHSFNPLTLEHECILIHEQGVARLLIRKR